MAAITTLLFAASVTCCAANPLASTQQQADNSYLDDHPWIPAALIANSSRSPCPMVSIAASANDPQPLNLLVEHLRKPRFPSPQWHEHNQRRLQHRPSRRSEYDTRLCQPHDERYGGKTGHTQERKQLLQPSRLCCSCLHRT